jgi:hypothetical protein
LTCDRIGARTRAPGAMKGAKKGIDFSTSLLLNDIKTLPAQLPAGQGSC